MLVVVPLALEGMHEMVPPLAIRVPSLWTESLRCHAEMKEAEAWRDCAQGNGPF